MLLIYHFVRDFVHLLVVSRGEGPESKVRFRKTNSERRIGASLYPPTSNPDLETKLARTLHALIVSFGDVEREGSIVSAVEEGGFRTLFLNVLGEIAS